MTTTKAALAAVKTVKTTPMCHSQIAVVRVDFKVQKKMEKQHMI